MINKRLVFTVFSSFLFLVFTSKTIPNNRVVKNKVRRGIGLNRKKRDGSGPNINCKVKQQNNIVNNSKRVLRRDGTGSNKDGRGPRESKLGSRYDCSNK